MVGAVVATLLGAGALPALAAPNLSGRSPPARVARRHRHRMVKLRGTKRVRSFTFRAGTTYLATRTLKIVASGRVTVDGPIELSANAGLSIRAGGRLVIRAPIGPAPGTTRTAASATASAAQADAGCKPAETDVFEALGITIDSSIDGARGATAEDGRGCDGGDVSVRTSFRDIILGHGASIRGGQGGVGGIVTKRVGYAARDCTSDHRSTNPGPASNATFEQTGDGGDGGNVTLKTSNVAIGSGVVGPPGVVVGGLGGDGRFVGVLTAPDGTADRGGGDVWAISGNGGRGGDATLVERFLTHPNRHRPFGKGGPGGAPGGGVLRAGSGGPPNCDGGDFYFGAGRTGAPGKGALTQDVRHAPLEVLHLVGGNAYLAEVPSPLNGGNGGSAYVYDQASRRTGALDEASLAFAGARDAGNGAPGSDGCSLSPAAPGGAGGGGGVLGGNFGDHKVAITNSFNGRTGGDGNPAGAGGEATAPPPGPSETFTESFQPGRPGYPCPVTPPPPPPQPTEQVVFNGDPFSAAGIASLLPDASAPAPPSDPDILTALGATSAGQDFVIAFDVQTLSPDPAVGGGTGYFALPSGPTYVGVTRVAPNDTIAWSDANGTVDYSAFNDSGTMTGSGSLPGGTINFATVQVYNVQTATGTVVYFTGIDLSSHHDAVASANVSSSGVVTTGPCTPTVFDTIGTFGATGLAVDPATGAIAFAGLMNNDDNGIFITDSHCSNPTAPVSLGAAAGDTVPTATSAGAGDTLVYGTIPLPGNDQAPVIYLVDKTGAKVSSFTSFQGANASQAGATGVFLTGSDAVAIGDVSDGTTQGTSTAINATTGALDGSATPNPLAFGAPDATSSVVPQSVQLGSSGTVVVFGNTDAGANVTVLKGVP